MAKKKFYAVIKGRNPGIYQEWFGENRVPVAASKCIKTAGIKMYGFFEG